MRQIIILLLISSIASGQSLGRYPFARAHPSGSDPTWTNLVGYWSLLDGSLVDSAGSDNMIATNAVNHNDTCFYLDGDGDYLSFTGTTNTECTWMMEVWMLDSDSADLLGASVAGAVELYTFSTTSRPRAYLGGGGGTSVPIISITPGQWVWLTITVSDATNTVKYGIDGVYESETDWTNTITTATNRIGSYSVGGLADPFYGYIRRIWKFSDLKAESYTTSMEGRTYAEGDPE